MKTILLPLALLLLAAPAAAQRRPELPAPAAAPVLVADARLLPAADTTSAAGPRRGRPERLARRGFAATLGMVGGAFVGGVAGAALETGLNGSDGGEWEGVAGALLGGLTGGTIGAGTFAALENHGGRCDFEKRAGYGILGAVGGAGVGVSLTSLSLDSGELLLAIPLGIVLGSAIGADC